MLHAISHINCSHINCNCFHPAQCRISISGTLMVPEMLLHAIQTCMLYTYETMLSKQCMTTCGHLQEAQKQEPDMAVRQHLELMKSFGAQIANAATAKDVDMAMRKILDSQMALSQEGFDRVVAVNQSVQALLANVCMLPMLSLVQLLRLDLYIINTSDAFTAKAALM
jgi:hypothetical protein